MTEAAPSLLETARLSFAQGDFDQASQQAAEAARDIQLRDHPEARARALMLQGQADTMVSRIRSAHNAYHRASHAARDADDMTLEAQSLALLSYTAGMLGQVDEALETGLLGLRLADVGADRSLLVTARNSMGIAHIWSSDFDEADAMLAEADDLASRYRVPPEVRMRPSINRCFNEALRQLDRRQHTGQACDPTRLGELLGRLHRLLEQDHRPRTLDSRMVVKVLGAWLHGIAACWRGDAAAAQAYEHAGWDTLASWPHTRWLGTVMKVLGCERLRAAADHVTAEQMARQLIALATEVEHQQMALIGHLLVIEALVAQGREADALAEQGRMRRRELDIRRASLDHRRQVAAWRFELRQRSHQVEHLQASSRQFQKLSLEDSLTGLPNRRQLEDELAGLLHHPSTSPVWVALLDVDHFKNINDMHSHVVGDGVLRGLASILRAQLRVQDLPARLAGDEFVVLLRGMDETAALAACQRLRHAVSRHPWATLSPGLEVSVSIGLARVLAGDTVDTLLRRGDSRMYADKRMRQNHRA